MPHLRIGSRGSQLALWQANHVAARLRDRQCSAEITVIQTTGDKVLDVALAKVGVKGMFTKEIEEALAEDRIDLAVHSLKDLPTELDSRFAIAAVLPREDARDAFVSTRYESIDTLPKNARVGTSSLRRQAQLKVLRPDLTIHPLRGNVDTRLKKLASGDYDAIILAHAGLLRLGRTESVRAVLDINMLCPAAGQGALAIEIRAGDEATRALLAFLDDPSTRDTTECERALLTALGGGCQVPIGAHCTRQRSGELHLTAVVAHPDGRELLRAEERGNNPENLGRELGLKLLDMGARQLLAEVYKSGAFIPEQP